MRTRRFAGCLVLVSAGLLCGCHTVRYRDVAVPILKSGLVDPQARQIALTQVDAKSGQPATNVVISILSSQHPRKLRTDAQGVVFLPLAEVYFQENPRLKHDYRGKLIMNFTSTGTFSFGTNQQQQIVSLKDKFTLTNGNLCVYYPLGLGTAARQTMRELLGSRDDIARILGVQPLPWGIVILPEKATNMDYVVTGMSGGPHIWSYSVAELDGGSLAQINTHEWTEQTLDQSLHLHDADRRNRFVLDGLAEWMAWRHAGLPPKYGISLEDLAHAGTRKVDLLKKFQSIRIQGVPSFAAIKQSINEQGFPAGYALSLAFWHRLCEAHGDDLPKRLLARLRQQPQRDLPAVLRILGELTGEKDLSRRLHQADVSEALARLQPLRTKA